MILFHIFVIVIGLAFLYKGADWLLKAGVYIAEKTGIPKFVVGLTAVAIGTSIPELIINIVGGYQEQSALIVANVLGSNISNILLVLGAAAIIKPIRIKKMIATRDIPFLIASIAVFSILVLDSSFGGVSKNTLTAGDGLIMLIMFLIFVYYVVFSHKEHREVIKSQYIKTKIQQMLLYGILGLGAVVVGGSLVVENSILIARELGVSGRIIGLSIISLGTSLPELVTVIVAIRKNEVDLGIGNIVGSNVVNILLILGLSVIVNPIQNITNIGWDLFMLSVATSLLLLSLFTGEKNKIDRLEGVFFVFIYFVYIASIFAV